jgi:hypothetical protein
MQNMPHRGHTVWLGCHTPTAVPVGRPAGRGHGWLCGTHLPQNVAFFNFTTPQVSPQTVPVMVSPLTVRVKLRYGNDSPENGPVRWNGVFQADSGSLVGTIAY